MGSSTRKGVQALLSMKNAMQQGSCGVFALDGPRGPIFKSKPGIFFLAQKMGYPIVPVATSADRAWIVKNTWCRYLLPKPFARCYIALGKPLWEATTAETLAPAEMDRIMVEWTAEADRKMGRTPETVADEDANQDTVSPAPVYPILNPRIEMEPSMTFSVKKASFSSLPRSASV